MVQKIKIPKKKRSGPRSEFEMQLKKLNDTLSRCAHNTIIIYDWLYKKRTKFWSRQTVTRRRKNITIETVSTIPGSKEIAKQIWLGLDKWSDLPSNKRKLAKFLDKLLKDQKLDKYWLIYYQSHASVELFTYYNYWRQYG